MYNCAKSYTSAVGDIKHKNNTPPHGGIDMELRDYIQQTGRSQRQFAIAHGFEPSLLSSYVHGKPPNQRNALRLAEALRVDVRELFPDFDSLRSW